jgi:hypothetical protein
VTHNSAKRSWLFWTSSSRPSGFVPQGLGSAEAGTWRLRGDMTPGAVTQVPAALLPSPGLAEGIFSVALRLLFLFHFSFLWGVGTLGEVEGDLGNPR